MIRLHGMPGSPFVRKSRVALLEKGVPFEDVFTSIFALPEGFERINPMRRVPVLEVEHEGEPTYIADTTAIAQYLERAHPEPALYPSDPVGHGRAMMWEEYADTGLAAAIGLGVFRPLVTAQLVGATIDHARVRRTLEEKLPPMFTTLEEELGDRSYFTGTFSTVDIAVATHFVNLNHAGQDLDAARWPALAAWLEGILARDSFQACVALEAGMPPAVRLE